MELQKAFHKLCVDIIAQSLAELSETLPKPVSGGDAEGWADYNTILTLGAQSAPSKRKNAV